MRVCSLEGLLTCAPRAMLIHTRGSAQDGGGVCHNRENVLGLWAGALGCCASAAVLCVYGSDPVPDISCPFLGLS